MAEYGRIWQIAIDCGNLVIGLWLLSRWKQVDVYNMSRGCPVTVLNLLEKSFCWLVKGNYIIEKARKVLPFYFYNFLKINLKTKSKFLR